MEKNKEEVKEEILLVVFRNLRAQLVPVSFSLGGLVDSEPILVLKGTFREILLNLQEKN